MFWLGYNTTHQKCISDQNCDKPHDRQQANFAIDNVLHACSEYDLLPTPICTSKCKKSLKDFTNTACSEAMMADRGVEEKENFVQVRDTAQKRCFHEGCDDATELSEAWKAIDDLRDWCATEAKGDTITKCTEQCASALVLYDSKTCVQWIWHQMVGQMSKNEQTRFWDLFNNTRKTCESFSKDASSMNPPVTNSAPRSCTGVADDLVTATNGVVQFCKNLGMHCPNECTESLRQFNMPAVKCRQWAISSLSQDDQKRFKKRKNLASALCLRG